VHRLGIKPWTFRSRIYRPNRRVIKPPNFEQSMIFVWLSLPWWLMHIFVRYLQKTPNSESESGRYGTTFIYEAIMIALSLNQLLKLTTVRCIWPLWIIGLEEQFISECIGGIIKFRLRFFLSHKTSFLCFLAHGHCISMIHCTDVQTTFSYNMSGGECFSGRFLRASLSRVYEHGKS